MTLISVLHHDGESALFSLDCTAGVLSNALVQIANGDGVSNTATSFVSVAMKRNNGSSSHATNSNNNSNSNNKALLSGGVGTSSSVSMTSPYTHVELLPLSFVGELMSNTKAMTALQYRQSVYSAQTANRPPKNVLCCNSSTTNNPQSITANTGSLPFTAAPFLSPLPAQSSAVPSATTSAALTTVLHTIPFAGLLSASVQVHARHIPGFASVSTVHNNSSPLTSTAAANTSSGYSNLSGCSMPNGGSSVNSSSIITAASNPVTVMSSANAAGCVSGGANCTYILLGCRTNSPSSSSLPTSLITALISPCVTSSVAPQQNSLVHNGLRTTTTTMTSSSSHPSRLHRLSDADYSYSAVGVVDVAEVPPMLLPHSCQYNRPSAIQSPGAAMVAAAASAYANWTAMSNSNTSRGVVGATGSNTSFASHAMRNGGNALSSSHAKSASSSAIHNSMTAFSGLDEDAVVYGRRRLVTHSCLRESVLDKQDNHQTSMCSKSVEISAKDHTAVANTMHTKKGNINSSHTNKDASRSEKSTSKGSSTGKHEEMNSIQQDEDLAAAFGANSTHVKQDSDTLHKPWTNNKQHEDSCESSTSKECDGAKYTAKNSLAVAAATAICSNAASDKKMYGMSSRRGSTNKLMNNNITNTNSTDNSTGTTVTTPDLFTKLPLSQMTRNLLSAAPPPLYVNMNQCAVSITAPNTSSIGSNNTALPFYSASVGSGETSSMHSDYVHDPGVLDIHCWTHILERVDSIDVLWHSASGEHVILQTLLCEYLALLRSKIAMAREQLCSSIDDHDGGTSAGHMPRGGSANRRKANQRL